MEKLEPSYVAGRKVIWCSHFGPQNVKHIVTMRSINATLSIYIYPKVIQLVNKQNMVYPCN